MAAIRLAVTEAHEVQPYAIALIARGTLLKTTSGKVQRRASRAAFLENRLTLVQLWRIASTEPAVEPAIAPPVELPAAGPVADAAETAAPARPAAPRCPTATSASY
jgi:hypothetical protein